VLEIIACIEERLITLHGQRVCKAIAQVQSCGMAATLTEVSVRSAGNAHLRLSYLGELNGRDS
jgi:hypothetical protein